MIPAPGQVQVTGCTWFLWGLVTAVRNRRRENEVTAQVRNVLQEGELMPQRNVIEQDEVLMHLPHVPYMWNYRK